MAWSQPPTHPTNAPYPGFLQQVYSVAAYVEADRAAKELGLRQRGGFFDTDDDYGQAIIDGAFNKALVVGAGPVHVVGYG